MKPLSNRPLPESLLKAVVAVLSELFDSILSVWVNAGLAAEACCHPAVLLLAIGGFGYVCFCAR